MSRKGASLSKHENKFVSTCLKVGVHFLLSCILIYLTYGVCNNSIVAYSKHLTETVSAVCSVEDLMVQLSVVLLILLFLHYFLYRHCPC